MPSSIEIVACEIVAPTLERAKTLVPPEFIPAYRRIQEYAGNFIPQRPWTGQEMAVGLPVKLAAQRGIHKPRYSELQSKGEGKAEYALTVFSSAKGRYSDKRPIMRSDGTWVFEYSAQTKAPESKKTQDYTPFLMNCLEDGVPVGVFVQEDGGYRVLGLAFVEQYVSATDSFILHGPVNAKTEADQVFYAIHPEELSEAELKNLEVFKDITKDDERTRKAVTRVVRERQQRFRKELMDAYEGACSITSVTTPEVLQAAHIDPYRGRKSQLVNNGLLLRADVHLLYDAQLLSVEPETHVIHVSKKVQESLYRNLEGEHIRMPRDKRLRPNEELLDQQFKLYEMANAG